MCRSSMCSSACTQVDSQQKAEAQADIVKLQGWLSDTQQEALMLRADMQERTERHAVEVHIIPSPQILRLHVSPAHAHCSHRPSWK